MKSVRRQKESGGEKQGEDRDEMGGQGFCRIGSGRDPVRLAQKGDGSATSRGDADPLSRDPRALS